MQKGVVRDDKKVHPRQCISSSKLMSGQDKKIHWRALGFFVQTFCLTQKETKPNYQITPNKKKLHFNISHISHMDQHIKQRSKLGQQTPKSTLKREISPPPLLTNTKFSNLNVNICSIIKFQIAKIKILAASTNLIWQKEILSYRLEDLPILLPPKPISKNDLQENNFIIIIVPSSIFD